MDLIVFPNQLYEKHPGLALSISRVIMVEDSLFFGDRRFPCSFHKQKLWLHRASMKRYENTLKEQGYRVEYLDYAKSKITQEHLNGIIEKCEALVTLEPEDFILKKRLIRLASKAKIEIKFLDNPGFINRCEQNAEYRAGKKRWFMADFYKWQRKRLNILMNGDVPNGGKWSFDEANRKKVPKKKLSEIPVVPTLQPDEIDDQARQYVMSHFGGNPGELNELYYPTTHSGAKKWLEDFFEHRFERFGDFEDAIVENESWLWHSVLTPTLNIGLLTPEEVVTAALEYSEKRRIPINSVEGFVRQIIGWREFMRATYHDLGVAMRTTNHWNHRRSIPVSFYNGTSGIAPVDNTIKRILKTGYCHHIERLMVLGGFMFLCEFDPNEIYRWFMELFIDSYDWVMVPNVYAMSQNSDGGLITTKPYFSGSSYIRKMSHYKTGQWCEIWDGLYWRWIWNHVDELSKNPRWAMMCRMAKKMDRAKMEAHIENADQFLSMIESEQRN